MRIRYETSRLNRETTCKIVRASRLNVNDSTDIVVLYSVTLQMFNVTMQLVGSNCHFGVCDKVLQRVIIYFQADVIG